MKISVKVKPQAKQDMVRKIGPGDYTVWVKAKALEGKANQAVVEVLAEYFGVAKSKIALLKGKKTRNKVFMVER
ncbi:MAG: DUF167 domain-containing protein [Candidatus Omnitrophota bacterium]|nr:MAG: DUF167 domain-containing protein [Candidatus Omnitrophota bacterium]